MPKPKSRRTPDTRARRKPAAKRSPPAAVVAAAPSPEPKEAAAAAQALTRTFTVREFAALFDVSPDTVSRWCAGGMPHEVPGKANAGFAISLAAACPWVRQYASEQPPESQGARLKREQADKFALENAVRRGELVEAVAVAEVFKSWALALKAQCLLIQNRTSHEFAGINDPQRIRERQQEEFSEMQRHMAAITRELAAACERVAADLDADGAAAASDAFSVGRPESGAAEGEHRAG